MNFFGATEQAQEALHNVLFYALINEEGTLILIYLKVTFILIFNA